MLCGFNLLKSGLRGLVESSIEVSKGSCTFRPLRTDSSRGGPFLYFSDYFQSF